MLKKFLISLTFISFLILTPSSFASTLNLSPGSANIPQGSTVYVQVRLNTAGESINGVSAYLSYPSALLDVVSIGYGSSAFSIAAESAYAGGSIRISRGSISGATGNVGVATIGFRGKSQGTATVSFVGGSGAPRTSDSSDSLNLGGSSGGTYTVGPPQKISPQDKTMPVITSVLVSNLSTNSATITWTTDKKADSTVEYGLNKDKYILDTYDKNLLTDHSVILEGPALTPGAVMHFRVKSNDSAGNEGVSSNYTFHLIGYDVKIKLIDSNNNPVADTEVILYSSPVKSATNQNGEVTFTDVSAGRHLVVVKLKNNTEITKEIEVKEDSIPTQLTLTLDATSGDNNNVLLTIFYLSLAILIAIAVVGIVMIRKKANPPTNPPINTTILNSPPTGSSL